MNDKVIFSGKFYPDSNRGVVEASLTEEGWVTDPGFLVDFCGEIVKNSTFYG